MRQVAVVTGAAHGIGLRTARLLAQRDFAVAAVDVDAMALRDEFGPEFESDVLLALAGDVSDAAQMAKVIQRVVDQFGRIDVLVNNAALHAAEYNRPCLDMPMADWLKMLQVNLIGPINMTREAAAHLAENEGVIVNVSSMSAFAFDPPTAYAVSKAALSALTLCLAHELGSRRVRVVGIAPGLVTTATVLAGVSEQTLAKYIGGQTIADPITDDDVAEAITLLASSRARVFNGHTVLADLGYTRRV
jgi:3-oxoacyl-[acyl-carrier protein] reductase